ncbi:MAG: ion transporter [Ectothiorhodospiraceae bacterium]|nr:ion transporter [Ectothiorhodospiraceae bacterium]
MLELYFGRTRRARRFRYVLLAIDLLTVVYFVVTTFLPLEGWVITVDFGIGIFVLLDLAARFVATPARIPFLYRASTLADLLVAATLLAPAVLGSFAFLRVLRAVRLFRSYHVLRELREDFPFFRRNEDVIHSVINLFVFIFVISALVFVLQHPVNPDVANYVDALYFTVTTLTTTGFGDITLKGEYGRLLAVAIMIVGISLFLRLLQAIFRPAKVRHDCPSCGLARHDPDAVHCKHCGEVLKIATEGE